MNNGYSPKFNVHMIPLRGSTPDSRFDALQGHILRGVVQAPDNTHVVLETDRARFFIETRDPLETKTYLEPLWNDAVKSVVGERMKRVSSTEWVWKKAPSGGIDTKTLILQTTTGRLAIPCCVNHTGHYDDDIFYLRQETVPHKLDNPLIDLKGHVIRELKFNENGPYLVVVTETHRLFYRPVGAGYADTYWVPPAPAHINAILGHPILGVTTSDIERKPQDMYMAFLDTVVYSLQTDGAVLDLTFNINHDGWYDDAVKLYRTELIDTPTETGSRT